MDKLLETAAWPLALAIVAIAFFVVFRSPISELLRRARGVTYGNKSIDLSGGQASVAVERQKETEPPQSELVAPDMVPASHAMPPASEIHAPFEQGIKAALPDNLPRDLEKAWLIRAVAVARVQRAHEINYRTILGSQIALMQLANTSDPPTTAKAREIYDGARAAFPVIYANFAFETWSHWPVMVGLLRTEQTAAGSSLFRITPAGRDFLHYLIDNSLTARRIG
jgi:hypothetical protein